jgi:hypothetical protein
MYVTCLAHLIFINLVILIICGEEYYLMKLLIMKMSPFSCCSLLPGSKYSPQHSVLKHPQSTEDSAVYCMWLSPVNG